MNTIQTHTHTNTNTNTHAGNREVQRLVKRRVVRQRDRVRARRRILAVRAREVARRHAALVAGLCGHTHSRVDVCTHAHTYTHAQTHAHAALVASLCGYA